jgi:hypothetical protein
MQLRILRRESKGMLGGLSFEYSIKIMPNQQELELIQKYKMDREVIYQMERQLLGQKWEVTFTVGDFIRGKNCSDPKKLDTKVPVLILALVLAAASTSLPQIQQA